VRATDAVVDGDLVRAGWVVIVEGVRAVDLSQSEDARQIRMALTLTSGATASQTFHFPAMIYRGVWREGVHVPGDVATWAGSAWHCQRETTDKPGTSDAWRLMVKSGRDGKDGVAIPQPAAKDVIRLK
jgi:hypothetical protein